MKHSSMPLSYSQCTPSDLDLLVEVSRETFIAAFEKDNNAEDFQNYVNSAFSKEKILSELRNKDSFFYFVYYQDILAGYFKLNLGEAQTDVRDSNSMELERIYVKESHQNMGIGAWMFEEILTIARKENLEYLWLGVWEKNPGAIRFYQRYGLKKFGTHPYLIGTDKQTDWLLRLDL